MKPPSLSGRAAIIPAPTTLTPLSGRLTLSPETRIAFAAGLASVARFLQAALQNATGWPFEMTEDFESPARSAIVFAIDDTVGNAEGYRLRIDEAAARVFASRPAGAFYAAQTLLQLLPPAVHQGVPRCDISWSLPCLAMSDAPRFSWRGAMLDSSRHFQPVAFIKKFLDLLALHKLNVFHWHLTDDQGWRLEIKKYPRLTGIGSRRAESLRGHLACNAGGDGIPHEGFYTQEDVREIVAYAAEHFVTIVPEIEMPGHAQAAVASYPEFGCTSERPSVSTTWGVHKCLYNPGEDTFAFLQDILDEVMTLFPGEFIHIGGDEAEKDQWQNSPAVIARMRELGVSDVHALQSYFVGRMAKHLEGRGRRLIGWEEIQEGGLPRGAALMSWRGIESGIAAANAGYDVVMAPQQHTYLDFYQSLDTTSEPLCIHGHLPLENVHAYEPIPEEVCAENASHILGIQGQIWTEYLATPGQVEYMAFPRLTALAEVAWSSRARPDFADFRARLVPFLKRLDLLGVRYRPLD